MSPGTLSLYVLGLVTPTRLRSRSLSLSPGRLDQGRGLDRPFRSSMDVLLEPRHPPPGHDRPAWLTRGLSRSVLCHPLYPWVGEGPVPKPPSLLPWHPRTPQLLHLLCPGVGSPLLLEGWEQGSKASPAPHGPTRVAEGRVATVPTSTCFSAGSRRPVCRWREEPVNTGRAPSRSPGYQTH